MKKRTKIQTSAVVLTFILTISCPAPASADTITTDPPLRVHSFPEKTQSVTVDSVAATEVGSRDQYTVTDPPPPPPVVPPKRVLPKVTPDPGSAQAIAADQVSAHGWGSDQFDCLVALWSKESGWRVNANNNSSGAYGIPQALPGSKMATYGDDWETNPATQITWGLSYISGRYGNPCNAWNNSVTKGWY